MKRIISIFLTLVLVFGLSINCYAADESDKISTTGVIDLTLDDALKMVEANNKELKSMDLQIETLKNQYDDYKYNDLIAKKWLKTGEGDSAFLMAQVYNPKQALFQLSNARRDREERLKALMQDVKKQYLQALLLSENIKDTNTEIVLTNKKIDEIWLRFKLSLVKYSDLETYENSLTALKSQLNTYNNQYNQAIENLKNMLTIEQTDSIKLYDAAFEYSEYNDTNIEEKITKAVENSYDLEKQKQNITLAKIQYDIYDTEEMKNSLDIKNYSYDSTKFSVENNLWNSYHNLINLNTNVETEKRKLSNELNNLNMIAVKKKFGMVTALDEMNEQLKYSKQKNQLQSAINDYMLYVDTFKNTISEE